MGRKLPLAPQWGRVENGHWRDTKRSASFDHIGVRKRALRTGKLACADFVRRFIVAMVALSVSNPCLAADRVLYPSQDKETLETLISRLANYCSRNYAFTRLPEQPHAVMINKLEAYEKASHDPNAVEENWRAIFQSALAIQRANDDKAFTDHLADLKVEAANTPSSYEAAEADFISAVMIPNRETVRGCNDAARDPFISANYLTGEDSADHYIPEIKQAFSSGVALLKSLIAN